MKKFKDKKVIRKQVGGNFIPSYEEGPALYNFFEDIRSDMAKDIVSPKEAAERAKRMSLRAAEPKIAPLRDPSMRSHAYPGMASLKDLAGRSFASPGSKYGSGAAENMAAANIASFLKGVKKGSPASHKKGFPAAPKSGPSAATRRTPERAASPNPTALNAQTRPIYTADQIQNLMNSGPDPLLSGEESRLPFPSSDVMGLPSSREAGGRDLRIESAMYDLAKNANLPGGAVPKSKSGMKQFMDQYGKFIALGALAGTGGKAGRIAAPILAALPGIIGMMKKKKSSEAEPPKKSEGGAIRKFKGGSMKGNTMDSKFTPKYAKGGDMPKGMPKGKMGKAAGEMPQHKKMAMGKPTPQSMGQKFAKGGAAKYASGGMCKGYGISKKIRPTGPMN